MNKKFIKTILILLIITVIIFAIIAAFNIRRDKNTGFSSSTNYSQKTTTNNTVKKQETSSGYEIGSKKNPVLDFANNYVILLIGSITLAVLFILFYVFLSRKKEW